MIIISWRSKSSNGREQSEHVQELPSRRFPVLATILPPERRQCFRRLHITDVATVFSAVTNVVLIVIGTASEYAFLSLMKVINWRRNLATSEAKGHLFLTESWGYCSDLGGQRSATTYSLAYKRVRDRKRTKGPKKLWAQEKEERIVTSLDSCKQAEKKRLKGIGNDREWKEKGTTFFFFIYFWGCLS